jgi:hypothetical protein
MATKSEKTKKSTNFQLLQDAGVLDPKFFTKEEK